MSDSSVLNMQRLHVIKMGGEAKHGVVGYM